MCPCCCYLEVGGWAGGLRPWSVSRPQLCPQEVCSGGQVLCSGDRTLVLCHSRAKEVTREVYERLLSSSKSNTLSGNKKAEGTDGADVGRGWTGRASAGSFTCHRIPLCTLCPVCSVWRAPVSCLPHPAQPSLCEETVPSL